MFDLLVLDKACQKPRQAFLAGTYRFVRLVAVDRGGLTDGDVCQHRTVKVAASVEQISQRSPSLCKSACVCTGSKGRGMQYGYVRALAYMFSTFPIALLRRSS